MPALSCTHCTCRIPLSECVGGKIHKTRKNKRTNYNSGNIKRREKSIIVLKVWTIFTMKMENNTIFNENETTQRVCEEKIYWHKTIYGHSNDRLALHAGVEHNNFFFNISITAVTDAVKKRVYGHYGARRTACSP